MQCFLVLIDFPSYAKENAASFEIKVEYIEKLLTYTTVKLLGMNWLKTCVRSVEVLFIRFDQKNDSSQQQSLSALGSCPL